MTTFQWSSLHESLTLTVTEELLLHTVLPPVWSPVVLLELKMGLPCHSSDMLVIPEHLELPEVLK